MRPISFPQQTVELQKPASMTAEECGGLPVFRDGTHCISCWRPSWRERLALLLGRPVWLWVWMGNTQPPVALTVESPFEVLVKGEEPATGEWFRGARG